MVAKSGIAVGINKGHITARRELKLKPSNKIGVRMNGCTGY
jgi:large subunit ribosomal protein L36e